MIIPKIIAGRLRTALSVAAVFTTLLGNQARAASTSDFQRWDYKKNDGTVLQYGMLHVPSGYTSTQSYSLIIFYHGAGEVYNGSNLNAQVTSSNIDNLLSNAKANNCFLFAPQGTDWSIEHVRQSMLMAGEALRQYNIDPSRVYVTGLSLGGGATWAALKNYTGVPAASVPIAGTAGDQTTDTNGVLAAYAAGLVGKNIWAFHAADDPTVPVSNSQKYINAIRQADGLSALTFPTGTYPGGQNVYSNHNLKYTEFQTGGHGIWGNVYNTAALYTWMFSNTNTSLPLQPGETVNFHLGTYLPTNTGVYAYWNAAGQQTYNINGPTVAFARTTNSRQTQVSLHTTGSFGADNIGNSLPTDQNLYGNNTGNAGWGTTYEGTGTLVIHGLTPGANYNVSAFGSTNYSYISNVTKYVVAGQTKYLKVLNNTGSSAVFSINADSNGEIPIAVSGSGPGGDGHITGYLNTLVLTMNNSGTGDTQAPVVDIVNPTNLSTYSTNSSTINLGGSAVDDTAVTSITWSNNLGGSGTAAVSTNWVIGPIGLTSGTNVITVTAYDAAGNHGSDTLTVTYTAPPANQPPVTVAGTNSIITLPTNTANLNGSVVDDGLAPGNPTPTASWSVVSGPGSVTFASATTATTTATFVNTGTYVLRLTGNDGVSSTTSDVTVTVLPANTYSGTTGILTPDGSGQVQAGYSLNAGNMFNAQPTWDAVNGVPVGGDTSDGNSGYIKAGWDVWEAVVYIDFGPNWANKRIQETWTKYIVGRAGSPDPYVKLWWDNDITNTSSTATGAVLETTLNFDTKTHTGGEWENDVNVFNAPITPKGRYLKMVEGHNRSAAANEFAFVGYTVNPNPATVVTPAAWGSVHPTWALNAGNMFNAQPTWDAVNNTPVGGDTSDGNTGYIKAGFDAWQNKVYIDFGPNWQNVRILQTWTKYIVGRGGAPDPYTGVYWDDDNDDVMDSGTGNAVAEPTINFDTQTHVGGDWKKDVDVSTAPITPKGRYLILTEGANRSAAANEFCIIGYIVTP